MTPEKMALQELWDSYDDDIETVFVADEGKDWKSAMLRCPKEGDDICPSEFFVAVEREGKLITLGNYTTRFLIQLLMFACKEIEKDIADLKQKGAIKEKWRVQ